METYKTAAEWAGDPKDMDPNEKGLYPLVYDGKQLYVGREGLHHIDVIPAVGESPPETFYFGIAVAEDAPGWKVGTIEWIGGKGIPMNHEALSKEVSELIGMPFRLETTDEWKFGATEEPEAQIGITYPQAENWKTNHGNILNWTPGTGNEGRCLTVTNGDVITWNCNYTWEPFHGDIINMLDLGWSGGMAVKDGGYINSKGQVRALAPEDLERVQQLVNSEAEVDKDEEWTFSESEWTSHIKIADITPEGLKPWARGKTGRYIIDREGNTYSWDVNEATHDEIIARYALDYSEGGYISPEGEKDAWGSPMDWLFESKTRTLTEYLASARVPPIADFNRIRQHWPKGVSDPEEIWRAVNTGWQPGKEGKGLFMNGELYTWNTLNDAGDPHHGDVEDILSEAGIPIGSVPAYTLDAIGPDGSFESFQADPEVEKIVIQHDPRLKPMGDDAFDAWRTGGKISWPDEDIHTLLADGWKKGSKGKGINGADGKQYTWTIDGFGQPHHADVFQAIPGLNYTDLFEITADGKILDDFDMPQSTDWEF